VELATGLEPCSSWQLRHSKAKATLIGMTLSRSFTSSYGCAFGMAMKRPAIGANESKSNKRRVRLVKASMVRSWYTGTYAEIANIKRGHMVGFENVTTEFAPEF